MKPEEVERVICGLLSSCKELLVEMGKQRAGDWQIINDGMVSGEKMLREIRTNMQAKRLKAPQLHGLFCMSCDCPLDGFSEHHPSCEFRPKNLSEPCPHDGAVLYYCGDCRREIR